MDTIYFYPFCLIEGNTPSKIALEEAKKIVPTGKILYISPSKRKAEDIKLIFKNKDIEFFSLDGFADKLCQSVNLQKSLAERFKNIYILDIISKSDEFNDLFSNSSGTVNVLSDFITDLKFHGFADDISNLKEKIKTLLEGYDRVKMRALFAVDLFEKYQKRLLKDNYYDEIDKLNVAAKILKESKGFYDLTILDGFFDIPKAQEQFLKAIIEKSRNNIVLFYWDNRIQEIQGIKENLLSFLSGIKKFERQRIDTNVPVRIKKENEILKALSIEDEVTWIARDIKEIVDSKNGTYSDIIVTFPSMHDYYPYIERIFKKTDIPFSTSFDRPYSSLPQIAPLISLLNSVIEDYPRRAVVDCLTSKSFLEFCLETRAFLSALSRKVGIVCGINQWKELDVRVENEDKYFFNENKEGISKIKEDIEKYIENCEKIASDQTLLEFIKNLKGLLNTLKFNIGNKEINNIFHVLIDNMEEILKCSCGIKNSKAENIKIFLNVLFSSTYSHEKSSENSVKILGVLDTRGLYSKYLFFGGLTDGAFPYRPKQEMIIPDKTRKELGLLHFNRRIELQKLHYYRLLQAPEKDVFLSFPAQTGDKLALPSNFLPELSGVIRPAKIKKPISSEDRQILDGGKLAIKLQAQENLGFIDKEKAKIFIEEVFSKKRSISVTALDRYISCPYIFYLENILKIIPLEEPGFEIESGKIGSILHGIMQKAFSPGEKNIDNLLELISVNLESFISDKNIHPFWKEHIQKRVSYILSRIVKQEKSLSVLFPKVFRIEEKGSIDLLNGKINVKGRIDRIDMNENKIMVIDYKSGKNAKEYFKKSVKGESVQLALYSKMIVSAYPELKISGLCIYDLKEGKLRFVKEEDIAETVEKGFVKAKETISKIFSAEFEKNENSGCYYCDYKNLCKKNA